MNICAWDTQNGRTCRPFGANGKIDKIFRAHSVYMLTKPMAVSSFSRTLKLLEKLKVLSSKVVKPSAMSCLKYFETSLIVLRTIKVAIWQEAKRLVAIT